MSDLQPLVCTYHGRSGCIQESRAANRKQEGLLPAPHPKHTLAAVTNTVSQVANNISRWTTVQSELNPANKHPEASGLASSVPLVIPLAASCFPRQFVLPRSPTVHRRRPLPRPHPQKPPPRKRRPPRKHRLQQAPAPRRPPRTPPRTSLNTRTRQRSRAICARGP